MGRRAFLSDPLNRITQYAYDSRGRRSGMTYPDGHTVSNSFDAASNLTRRQYTDGTDLLYSYDALNRLVATDGLALAYDAEDRVTNTVSSGVNFGAAYDPGGRLTSVTYNGGALTVTYTYDTRDRLVGVSDSLTGTMLNFFYDDAGRLTGLTRPNGVNGAYTYDAAGRLTRIQEGALVDLQYTLDPAGQVTNLDYTVPLDPTNSLTPALSNWVHDAAHQICNFGYAYDARGRMTNAPGRTFRFDDASRLTQVNGVTLSYNGLNDVVDRVEGGVTNRHYYNLALGLNPIVAERNLNTGQFLRFHVWSPGGALLYMIDVAGGNAVRHFHFDRVGTTLALTDAAGMVTDSYAYTPFGEPLGRTGTSAQPFLYVGRYGVRHEPEGNLAHMRARYYDFPTARFLSPDPVWPVLAEPMSLDPYQYAADNPLTYIDPRGLFSLPAYDNSRDLPASNTSGLAGLQEQLELAETSTGDDDPLDPIRILELMLDIEDAKKKGPLVPDFTGPVLSPEQITRHNKPRLFINRVSTTRSVMHGLGLTDEAKTASDDGLKAPYEEGAELFSEFLKNWALALESLREDIVDLYHTREFIAEIHARESLSKVK